MTTHQPAQAVLAAGALFTDSQGRVMLVRPNYKNFWDLPGGYVEPGESPAQACRREILEELGITPNIGRLLVTDWAPSEKEGDKVLFVFDGGELSQGELDSIQVQATELLDYQYIAPGDLPNFTIERLVRRISAALHAKEAHWETYLEHGISKSN